MMKCSHFKSQCYKHDKDNNIFVFKICFPESHRDPVPPPSLTRLHLAVNHLQQVSSCCQFCFPQTKVASSFPFPASGFGSAHQQQQGP